MAISFPTRPGLYLPITTVGCPALVDQELAEANTYLFHFRKACRTHMIFLSLSTINGVIGIPLLMLLAWLTESVAPIHAGLGGLAAIAIGFALAFAWGLQRNRLFREIQSLALKLQRAGLIVYKRPAFLINVLDASMEPPREGTTALNFEKLSVYELYDHFA